MSLSGVMPGSYNRKYKKMNTKTRRQFLGDALRLTAGGLALMLLGCRRTESGALFTNNNSTAHSLHSSDNPWMPAYARLAEKGELKKRGESLWSLMRSCSLCPRECGANRLKGQKGFCRADSRLIVSSAHPHFGEERPLVGSGGSGTVFFTHCGLRCVFCINWEISHEGIGTEIGIEKLAQVILALQKQGCHNINVVTPTHYSPHIVLALDIAAQKGLRLPLVYNTCGWERKEILELLDGVVDIYMPDFKFSDPELSARYCAGADLYPQITQQALLEMHRQVGTAHPAKDGLLYRGLLIRHLVMPNATEDSKNVLKWIAEHLPKDTYVNIMSQYRPVYRAKEFEEINRRLTIKEYREVVQYAKALGLTNLDIQGDL